MTKSKLRENVWGSLFDEHCTDDTMTVNSYSPVIIVVEPNVIHSFFDEMSKKHNVDIDSLMCM